MTDCHGAERWRLSPRSQERSVVPARRRRFPPFITQTSTIYLDIYGGSSIQRGGGRGAQGQSAGIVTQVMSLCSPLVLPLPA